MSKEVGAGGRFDFFWTLARLFQIIHHLGTSGVHLDGSRAVQAAILNHLPFCLFRNPRERGSRDKHPSCLSLKGEKFCFVKWKRILLKN